MMVSDLLQPLVDSPRLLFIVIMVAILIVGMVGNAANLLI
ncbi:putative membrane protein [Shigella boydii 4444-74]|nr:putative membrane protein [Shigella boydii 4444-74]